MMLLALALVAAPIEQPPRRSPDMPVKVATKTCRDLFDAAIAQRMADKSPGESRNMVVAGETYLVSPTKVPGAVWAIPTNLALGTIKAAASCFE